MRVPLPLVGGFDNRIGTHLSTREQIDPVLDELEFIFGLLSPDAQPQCEQLIATLMGRYRLAGMNEK